MTRNECIEKIQRLIPSPEVRHCIFRNDDIEFEDEFLCKKRDILVYFSNVINIAFLYIYMHFRKWKEIDNKLDTNKANNFVRVFTELNKIYNGTNLSFDIIESLLVDVQLDIAIDGLLSNELRLNNKVIKNDNFSKYAYIAKKSRTSYRLNDNLELAQLYSDLIDLISTFPFLRDLSFTKEQMENAYVMDPATNEKRAVNGLYNIVLQYDNLLRRDEVEYDVDLNTNYILIEKNGAYFCLERVEALQNDQEEPYLFLSYWQIGDFNNSINICVSSNEISELPNSSDNILIEYETAYEDFSYTMLPFDLSERTEEKTGFRIKNFYSINYKYIKNLALSISDVLTENSRTALVEAYGKKYNFIVRKEAGAREKVYIKRDSEELFYTWSEIITLLMVEEGTTNVLAYLVKKDKEILNKFLVNLEFRFGRNQFNHQIVYEKIQRSIQNFDKKMESDEEVNEHNKQAYDREFADHHAEIIANKLVYYISKAVNGNELKDFKISFPVSIRSKNLLLEEIKNSDLDFTVKQESIRSIVYNTIKSLYCFYSGFFAYADIKKDFDDESFYRSLTHREITVYQNQANNAFSKAVKKCMAGIEKMNDKTPIAIIDVFKNFCVESENNISNNEKVQLLKSALGKSKIMDVRVLDELKNTLAYDTDEDSLDILVSNIKSVFNYLMTGNSKKSNISLGTVFPYVATCEYTDVNRDGNIIYHFTIISAKGQEKNLRVLSEFKYELNKKYYFLPNKLSSDDRLNLWIEPVIIDFENFESNEQKEED